MDCAGFTARRPKWRLIKNMSRGTTRGVRGEKRGAMLCGRLIVRGEDIAGLYVLFCN